MLHVATFMPVQLLSGVCSYDTWVAYFMTLFELHRTIVNVRIWKDVEGNTYGLILNR